MTLQGFLTLRSTQASAYWSPDKVSLDCRLKFAIMSSHMSPVSGTYSANCPLDRMYKSNNHLDLPYINTALHICALAVAHSLLQCAMILHFSSVLALPPFALLVSLHCNAQWCTCSYYQFTATQNNIAVLLYLSYFISYFTTPQCTDVHLQLHFIFNF